VTIADITLPVTNKTLIIEGAGGLLVPITRQKLQIDMFAAWSLPIILCARTGLGTINHTLLSVEALHHRQIPLHGIIFIGDDNTDNIKTIAAFSGAKILGRIPHLNAINKTSLQHTFDTYFRIEDFT
jgi:dethiobiotin synthetase